MVAQRNIKVFKWFNFFTDLRFYSAVAILYFAQVSGSFALGMSVFSIIFISAAIFEVPTGIFSDMIGRKKTVTFGAVFITLAMILYAFGQYYFLILGAVAEGISRSFYSGNNNALLYDSLKDENNESEYDYFMGIVYAPTQIAAAVAAIIGGLIAFYSFEIVMWLSVLPQVACLALSLLLIEPKGQGNLNSNIFSHLKTAVGRFKINRRLRLLSISSIVSYGLGEAAWEFQTAFYNTIWPVWALGIAKTLSNIGAALSFRFSGRIIRRFLALRILLISSIYNRVINLIALIFPSGFSPILMSTTSLNFGVSVVAKSSLMQKEFSHEQRATMESLNSFAGSIFFAIAAYLLGLFADVVGPAKALILVNVLLFSVTWFYWTLFKQDKTIQVESVSLEHSH